MSKTLTEKEVIIKKLTGEGCTLMLYNDDVHTFDMVIRALVEICGHTPEQAEQCAFLVHHKGKCDVRIGSLEELTPMHTQLSLLGLSTLIHR